MQGPSAARPHVRAEDESSSSCKKALGHLNAEGDGNRTICVAFLAHASWVFFISIFFVCPCFWLQTFRSPGQMAAVNIQIGCTASVQGARTGLAAAARALRPSAQHMCAGAEAPSWLLGWEMEPGRPAAPPEQVET